MWKLALTTVGAIAIALQPTVSLTQETTPETTPEIVPTKITFSCDQKAEPPTTVVSMPGEKEPKPFLRWHSEYLLPEDSAVELCQQVAQKLQTKSEGGEKYELAAQQFSVQDSAHRIWKVCLVTNPAPDYPCTKSGTTEDLFSLNTKYKETFKCMMENTDPESCALRTLPITRSPLMSIPSNSYTPGWWGAIFR